MLEMATQQVLSFHDDLRQLPITPKVSAREIRQHLDECYGEFKAPVRDGELINDVARMLRDWNLQVTHPRYFGLFNPSVHAAGIAADLLVASTNPQLAVWSHAPASNEIERFTLRWLASRLGLPGDRLSACFTTGGAEANQSAILTAMTRSFPEFARNGVAGATARPVLYVSEESHHSFEKTAQTVGLGRSAVHYIVADPSLQMNVAELRARVESDRAAGLAPFFVGATAGTTAAGVVDPLPAIADLCRELSLWFHVDAAWGGAACLSPRLRPALAGIERADSVTWDAHKWMSVPMGAGMFFCVHPTAIGRTFEVTTPYMPSRAEEDPYVTSIQWSRRNIGLKMFMSLASLGADGYRHAIEHQAEMGDLLREQLALRGWRIVNESALPVVCFTHEVMESDAITASEVVNRLAERNFWVSEVRLAGGEPVLRACVTSYLTTPQDVKELARAAAEVVAARGAA